MPSPRAPRWVGGSRRIARWCRLGIRDALDVAMVVEHAGVHDPTVGGDMRDDHAVIGECAVEDVGGERACVIHLFGVVAPADDVRARRWPVALLRGAQGVEDVVHGADRAGGRGLKCGVRDEGRPHRDVTVRVDEAGDERASGEIDKPGLGPGRRAELGVASDRTDEPIRDRDSLGGRVPRIDRADDAAVQNEVGSGHESLLARLPRRYHAPSTEAAASASRSALSVCRARARYRRSIGATIAAAAARAITL